MRPRPVDGVARETRDDMPMTVRDGLSGILTIIDYDVQRGCSGGRLHGPAESGKQSADVRSVVLGKLAKVGMVQFRHDKHMAKVHRVDIEKRKDPIGFEDLVAGDFAGNDLAEKTTRISDHRESPENQFKIEHAEDLLRRAQS